MAVSISTGTLQRVPSIRLYREKVAPESHHTVITERKKLEWLREVERRSEFLMIKSTSEQKEAGEIPVDTAVIADRDGLPVLRIVLDLREFDPEDVDIDIEDDHLMFEARHQEEKGDEEYAQTKIRKFDLPENVDPGNMHYIFESGFLILEMPFHMTPKKKPQGQNVFPIVTDGQGRKRLQLVLGMDKRLINDKIKAKVDGQCLTVTSEVVMNNPQGQPVVKQFAKNFAIPNNIRAERAETKPGQDGRLVVELLLKEETKSPVPGYRCQITTEDIGPIV